LFTFSYFHLPRTSAIYIIENQRTLYSYTGSSLNVRQRASRHLQELRNLKHVNVRLQKDWNEQIENDFTIKILEFCHAFEIRDREQFWISSYLDNSKLLYNQMLKVPDRRIKLPEWKDENPFPRRKKHKRYAHKKNWY
jgi:group I intron endonuclease